MESSALVASVAGGNGTVSSASDVVLDLAATVDPDKVLQCRGRYFKHSSSAFSGSIVCRTQ